MLNETRRNDLGMGRYGRGGSLLVRGRHMATTFKTHRVTAWAIGRLYARSWVV